MRTADREANRALHDRFDDVYREYQRLRANLDDLNRQLSALQVTERSADGQVSATVGARGELLTLTLDDGVYRERDADALAAKITATVRRAAEAATTAVAQLVRDHLPASSGVPDFLAHGDFGSLLRRHDAARYGEGGRHG
ncbi:MAG TPA: YbaB/EbfC family nucleoid-associated protein [Micromonosporaceae bacterium]